MSWATTDEEQLSASPLRGVLLTLLLSEQEQPLHGYMLTTLVERRLGPAWGVTRQSVYRALGRLERDGLVSSALKTAAVRGQGHGQKVYSATGRAEAARAAWIESPISRAPVRMELHARIAMSRVEDAPQLRQVLDAYERECFEMLRESTEAEVPMGSWAGLALNLTRMAVDESLQAELRWIAKARGWIEEFLTETSSRPVR
jgi:DNA-binding PadR family transcriptional regulator